MITMIRMRSHARAGDGPQQVSSITRSINQSLACRSAERIVTRLQASLRNPSLMATISSALLHLSFAVDPREKVEYPDAAASTRL